MICDELSLPYDLVPDFGFPQVKTPEFLAINPNGRMPAIQDPNNNDLILWESGAIIEYLVDRYDKQHKLSFEQGTPEYYQMKQWLYFQASGQGPYYGQAVWFTRYHAEKLPSAVERYVNEIKRVSGVLELHLSKQQEGSDGPWLVGGKLSAADLSFVPWQTIAKMALTEHGFDEKEYPTVGKWMENMAKKDSVQKCQTALFQH